MVALRENRHCSKKSELVWGLLSLVGLGLAAWLAVSSAGEKSEDRLKKYLETYPKTNILVNPKETVVGIEKRLLGTEVYTKQGDWVIESAFIKDNGLPKNYDFRKLQPYVKYIFIYNPDKESK